MPYRIVVVEGPQEGESYPVDYVRGTIIGRSPSNNIFIKDRAVSRAHCQIRVDGDRCFIEDLGSTNGTFVGDERVTEAELTDGSVVRVGVNRFKLVKYDEQVMADTTAINGETGEAKE